MSVQNESISKQQKKKEASYYSVCSLFKEKRFKETSIIINLCKKVAEVSPVSIYNLPLIRKIIVALCINELFKDIIQEVENILISNIDYAN